MIKLCYNTNGLRSMPLFNALDAVKEHGFEGVELSLHGSHLHPFNANADEIKSIKTKLEKTGLFPACIATGCDNLLSDVRFEPSLINFESDGRELRIKLLDKTISIAKELGFRIVNFASGFKDARATSKESNKYLVEGISRLLERHPDIILAIEPEPDMFIGTTTDAISLIDTIRHPNFKLNLDIGHVYCCEETILENIEKSIPYTVHTHIEDIKNHIHHHQIPGDGDIDFHKVLKLFVEAGYNGYISVELYHHADVWQDALSRSHRELTKVLADLHLAEKSTV
ncbi:MAG: sugar phosphate isomerase/epimerase [Chloroflexia bacterium]|nr:sugar phosphate isomerase/epimerase [Chloroflexia bacterium]